MADVRQLHLLSQQLVIRELNYLFWCLRLDATEVEENTTEPCFNHRQITAILRMFHSDNEESEEEEDPNAWRNDRRG